MTKSSLNPTADRFHMPYPAALLPVALYRATAIPERYQEFSTSYSSSSATSSINPYQFLVHVIDGEPNSRTSYDRWVIDQSSPEELFDAGVWARGKAHEMVTEEEEKAYTEKWVMKYSKGDPDYIRICSRTGCVYRRKRIIRNLDHEILSGAEAMEECDRMLSSKAYVSPSKSDGIRYPFTLSRNDLPPIEIIPTRPRSCTCDEQSHKRSWEKDSKARRCRYVPYKPCAITRPMGAYVGFDNVTEIEAFEAWRQAGYSWLPYNVDTFYMPRSAYGRLPSWMELLKENDRYQCYLLRMAGGHLSLTSRFASLQIL